METIKHIHDLPVIAADAVHIWGARVSELADRLPALKAVLSPAEKEKAERFHRAADHDASIVARGALRILLAGYGGGEAAAIQFEYSKNGKPHAVDLNLDFNVSHSGEWVALAIGRSWNIGVDIEKIRKDVDVMSIASRYFTPEESSVIEDSEDQSACFFRFWSRKEAYVKARGTGLFLELSAFSVPFEDGEQDGWFFRQLQAGSRYASAVVTDRFVADMPCYDFGGLKWDS